MSKSKDNWANQLFPNRPTVPINTSQPTTFGTYWEQMNSLLDKRIVLMKTEYDDPDKKNKALGELDFEIDGLFRNRFHYVRK